MPYLQRIGRALSSALFPSCFPRVSSSDFPFEMRLGNDGGKGADENDLTETVLHEPGCFYTLEAWILSARPPERHDLQIRASELLPAD